VDAADRLILDESAALRAGAGAGQIAVIGDAYGALALGAAHDGAGVRAPGRPPGRTHCTPTPSRWG
jgi:16S rRNA (guanine1207-N2)-methyltransferase